MKRNSPLSEYLRRKGLTQEQFAQHLSSVSGVQVLQTRISQWVRLATIPRKSSRAWIRVATQGEVPVSAWDGLRK